MVTTHCIIVVYVDVGVNLTGKFLGGGVWGGGLVESPTVSLNPLPYHCIIPYHLTVSSTVSLYPLPPYVVCVPYHIALHVVYCT